MPNNLNNIKFKYALSRWHGATLFKVLQMPEEWRGKGDIYTTKNGIAISSSGGIELTYDEIFVRGVFQPCDNNVAILNCSKNQHRKIKAALCEFAAWANNTDGE